MPPKFDGRRFYLAAFLALAMVASLIWFNLQTSRHYAVEAVREALGPDAPAFVIDGRRDFLRPGLGLKYNNLWCGTFTSGPSHRFAVLVRQPGGRRYGQPNVLGTAISPSAGSQTEDQSAMLDACVGVRR